MSLRKRLIIILGVGNKRTKTHPKIRGRIRIESWNPSSMLGKDIKEMYEIYKIHHNMGFLDFYERTLYSFDRVGLFRNKKTGEIIGFFGLKFEVHYLEKSRKTFTTLYGGQMFIKPEYRKGAYLHKFTFKELIRWKIRHPFDHLVFWGDAISHKSYLLMAHAFKIMYPKLGIEIPEEYQELRDILGELHYPGLYQRGRGIVKKARQRVKEHELEITEKDLEDPLLRFYIEKNPGFRNGDGLILLIPATFKNILSMLEHAIKRSLRVK